MGGHGFAPTHYVPDCPVHFGNYPHFLRCGAIVFRLETRSSIHPLATPMQRQCNVVQKGATTIKCGQASHFSSFPPNFPHFPPFSPISPHFPSFSLIFPHFPHFSMACWILGYFGYGYFLGLCTACVGCLSFSSTLQPSTRMMSCYIATTPGTYKLQDIECMRRKNSLASKYPPGC